MDRNLSDGLRRVFNHYRIQQVLTGKFEKLVCPVCGKAKCKHNYNLIRREAMVEILRGWQEVIEMDIKFVPFIVTTPNILPLLVFNQPLVDTRVVYVPPDATLGLLHEQRFYTSTTPIEVTPRSNLPRYGWLKNNHFTPFAVFNNGYIKPINVISTGKPLLVPSHTVPCYNWSVAWQ